MININDVLRDTDNGHEFRVLWVSPKRDYAYLFDLSGKKMPLQVNLAYIETQLDEGKLEVTEDSYFRIISEDEIPDKAKDRREMIWETVGPLVEREPDILDKKLRGQMIGEIVDANSSAWVQMYRNMKRYWQYGKTKNAFLPNHQKCGGRGKEKSPTKKNGRQRKYGGGTGIVVNSSVRQIFEQAVKRFYHTRSEYSFAAAYDLMLKEYYTRPVEQPDGSTRLELLDENERPTLRQFRYWYSKHYNIEDKLVARKGQATYNLEHRAILGKSDTNVWGPGAQYQIDATVGDIYLVSRFNRANIIGRPVIYFIIDVFSRMVTGMYVGLEGPSWAGAMMALANAATEKTEYCRAYGINITDDQWPSRHLPNTILADRGEMESKSVETLINTLGVRVDNAPAYRADMKGIIEQYFNTINAKTTVYLPGHVKPDMAKRGGKDYRLDAKLDLNQFTKIMIQCALNHNNEHYLQGYERTEAMIADDVPAIPAKLWEWGIAHCSGTLRSAPADTIKLCLMPTSTALVTARGIRFKGMHYLSERAIVERWFETARSKGSYRIDISYDPRDMGYIYVRGLDDTAFEKCYLADAESMWLGKTLDEVQHQQASERALRAGHQEQELQGRVDLNTMIEEVVSEAEKMARQTVVPASKTERTGGIRGNRAAEKQHLRQQEAFVLGAENGLPPEVAEPDEEELSPILAMIKKDVEERLDEKF